MSPLLTGYIPDKFFNCHIFVIFLHGILLPVHAVDVIMETNAGSKYLARLFKVQKVFNDSVIRFCPGPIALPDCEGTV